MSKLTHTSITAHSFSDLLFSGLVFWFLVGLTSISFSFQSYADTGHTLHSATLPSLQSLPHASSNPPSHSTPHLSVQSPESSSGTPCGILENFFGDVEILDSSRTHLSEATVRAVLPCGSWVSVNQGWAQIRHQTGPHVSLAKQTFVQLLDFHPSLHKDPRSKGDHMLLYRGQTYIQTDDVKNEFRMVTATGRSRVKQGKAIFIFNSAENNTQLIALENSAILENRFEPSRTVRVQAGESTELNFKLLRVIPTAPSAVSVASLRPKLAQLQMSESDQFDAVRAVIRRQNRRFPSNLKTVGSEEKKDQTRKLAGTHSPLNYLRHPPGPADSVLHSHWIKKMVGGSPVGEKVLFPKKRGSRHSAGLHSAEDPSEKLDLKQKAQEDEEKKRLIDELSRIHTE